jgi:hypothetical protein
MTVTIRLSDEQAAVLEAQAAAEGLTVDVWLQRLAEQYAQSHPASRPTNHRPIWETILDNMKDMPPEELERLPRDGAREHDHYLYGYPKRNP